jgi:glutamyl-tRNA reductase
VDESLSEREQEAEKAKEIIENAVDYFMKWLNGRTAIPVIKALSQRGEEIRDIEVEKTLRKLGDLTEREEKIIRSMANAITNRLTHTPIIKLREYSQTDQGHLYANILLDLFDLQTQMDDESNADSQDKSVGARELVKA